MKKINNFPVYNQVITMTTKLLSSKFKMMANPADVKGDLLSVIVLGSYGTNETGKYSDIDIALLFNPLYFKKYRRDLSLQLSVLRDKIRKQFGLSISFWPKDLEMYLDFNRFESGTPRNIFELDGWSGLANNILLNYEFKTGQVVLGYDIIKSRKKYLSTKVPLIEGQELYLITTRDLAKGIGSNNYYYVAKSILRLAYSYYLWLNTEKSGVADKKIDYSILATYFENKKNVNSLNSYRSIMHNTLKTFWQKDRTAYRKFGRLLKTAYQIKTSKNSVNDLSLEDEIIAKMFSYVRHCWQHEEVKNLSSGLNPLSPYFHNIFQVPEKWAFYYDRTTPAVVEYLLQTEETRLNHYLEIFIDELISYSSGYFFRSVEVDMDKYILTKRHIQVLFRKIVEPYNKILRKNKPKLENSDSGLWFRVGMMNKLIGNYSQAVAAFERQIKVSPKHIPALTELGDIYLSKGDRTRARKCYKQAFRINNRLTEVYEKLCLLE